MTICAKFTNKAVFSLESTKTIEYYHSALGSVFSIFSTLIADSHLLYSSESELDHDDIDRVLEVVDDSMVNYIETFM